MGADSGSLCGWADIPRVRNEPCPFTPLYCNHIYYLRYLERELSTHKVIKEGVVDNTEDRTAFVDEADRDTDERETMNKIGRPICVTGQ